MGGGAHLRRAGPVPTVEQGLQGLVRNHGGMDPHRHDPTHAPPPGACMKALWKHPLRIATAAVSENSLTDGRKAVLHRTSCVPPHGATSCNGVFSWISTLILAASPLWVWRHQLSPALLQSTFSMHHTRCSDVPSSLLHRSATCGRAASPREMPEPKADRRDRLGQSIMRL